MAGMQGPAGSMAGMQGRMPLAELNSKDSHPLHLLLHLPGSQRPSLWQELGHAMPDRGKTGKSDGPLTVGRDLGKVPQPTARDTGKKCCFCVGMCSQFLLIHSVDNIY